jgi:hypothetical protein
MWFQHYNAKQIKSVLEHVKANKNAGIDGSKVSVTSKFRYNGDASLEAGIFVLGGIQNGAASYIVHYGTGCLATNNTSFPAQFKGTTLNKYMEMKRDVKSKFQDALDKANAAKKPSTCIKVFIKGEQDEDENAKFDQDAKNAPLVDN